MEPYELGGGARKMLGMEGREENRVKKKAHKINALAKVFSCTVELTPGKCLP